MGYECPVCGYGRLEGPPERYLICPCCGTEFGNDDEEHSHQELRLTWVLNGARWWSAHTESPIGWDAAIQLQRAGHYDPEAGVLV